MKELLLICFCLGPQVVLAQQGKYDIALSGGFYKAPAYQHSVSKEFFSVDFDYRLSSRWTISSSFLSGKFAYFDDYRSNNIAGPPYDPYTNAEGYESHTSLTILYLPISKSKFIIQLGSGISLFTQRLKYPYAAPSSYSGPRGLPIFTAEESFTKLELPIRIEGFYRLGTRFGVGLKAGTFVQQNWRMSGTFIGPQVRVSL